MSDSKTTSKSPFSGVCRATVSGSRKEGVSKEEFSRRFALHGEKAGPVAMKHNAISYLQHHLPSSTAVEFRKEIGEELAQHFIVSDMDGISTLIFPTVADMAAFFRDPAHAEYLNADVAEYCDFTTVQFSVGDELPVVVDGKFLL
ncbi:hypothetical protein PT974_00309 [Cladobotryum mycophilum]|uniref:EthD domain-containing protein n=1 Tax=Cladobotryum mycophilum TaxID=491253 RepID=A0ABR0T1Q8_9HYPO